MKWTDELRRKIENETNDLDEETAWDAIVYLFFLPLSAAGVLVMALCFLAWGIYNASDLFDRLLTFFFSIIYFVVALAFFYTADAFMSGFFNAIKKLLDHQKDKNPEKDPLKTDNSQGIAQKD